jgi:hypothetical protein
MYSCIGPHKNPVAKRAKGQINAHVDFGLGCAYGPNFEFKGTNWVLNIYAYDEGWFVSWPSTFEQLYYENLMDLYKDLEDWGLLVWDQYFASNHLETFWLLAYWDNQGVRPEIPESVRDVSNRSHRGPSGVPGEIGCISETGPQGCWGGCQEYKKEGL